MNWDEETGALIIGFGGAGATAAITAHDFGANVLIVEKMKQGGGNTSLSLGGFLSITDIDKGLLYLENLCNSICTTVDSDILSVYVTQCHKNKDWVEGFGVSTHVYGGASFPQLPGADAIEKRIIIGGKTKEGNAFWSLLKQQVEKRWIDLWEDSKAKDLITDASGAVIGATIQKGEKELAVKATNGVILTCGGFEYNDSMKMNYLKGYPYYSFGSTGNTGDGIKMAQRVGADLWHTSSVSVSLGFKTPDFDAAFMSHPPSGRFIYVDRHGKRFASEFVEHHAYHFIVDRFDPNTIDYPCIPCFMVFDETACSAGPVVISALGNNHDKYRWTKDNSQEISRGWIVSDQTLAGLAKKTGLNPCVLEETVNQYNRFCSIGEDQDYTRPKEKLAPIGPGPYYAMNLWPCLINTQGGPRRNQKAQVLYPDGQPIPNLYSAGELGSLFGLLYQGAGNLGECLAFGRIAGREATSNLRNKVKGKKDRS